MPVWTPTDHRSHQTVVLYPPTTQKHSSTEQPKPKEVQPDSPKLKEKGTDSAKKPPLTDEPKAKLPTPEPEPEVYRVSEGSEFYNLEDCEGLEVVNMDTFGQILELDEDDDDQDFAKDMVADYFNQALQTFKEMDEYFKRKDLAQLSSSGHFLKGSSAALGLERVQHICEKIQHCGALRDEGLSKDLAEAEAMDVMSKLLKIVKVENSKAEKPLKKYFDNVDDI